MTPGHFIVLLIVLSVGWNFGFAGASAMVLETHCPEGRGRLHSANNFIVFGSVAISLFLSGGVRSVGIQPKCVEQGLVIAGEAVRPVRILQTSGL